MRPAASHNDLVALARSDLPNYRVNRYKGDDLAVRLNTFTSSDRGLITDVYDFLKNLMAIVTANPDERDGRLGKFLEENRIERLVDDICKLGQETFRAHPTDTLAKAIHDIRGGGLTPLLGQLQLCALGVQFPPPYDSLFFLTRDHLKIMRNALLGLDDAKRNEDLQTKLHSTDFIVEKWQGAHLHAGTKETLLEVDCPEEVAISECCVEFGALDRILYNILNNACRHAEGEDIRLAIFRVPNGEGLNLRFVLLNRVSPSDEVRLKETDLRILFQTGVSTTGSGYGLSVAAEFVANAFGLNNPDEAVRAEYLGAKLLGHQFAVWFHWPIVTEC